MLLLLLVRLATGPWTVNKQAPICQASLESALRRNESRGGDHAFSLDVVTDFKVNVPNAALTVPDAAAYFPKEKIVVNADLYAPPAAGAPLPTPNLSARIFYNMKIT